MIDYSDIYDITLSNYKESYQDLVDKYCSFTIQTGMPLCSEGYMEYLLSIVNEIVKYIRGNKLKCGVYNKSHYISSKVYLYFSEMVMKLSDILFDYKLDYKIEIYDQFILVRNINN
ncbi:hypothetical protein A6B43_04785 [Vespertiliibacter pulmonis]|uniref:Uncharacterized protein n=1 Tax=Vespertiliibacter pulmonis TaxID=1443036 RepID=A0A3N4VPP3_9PAST|nr:hypothetical protein [Vespertiliibacter pulmonis]QLB20890.1 hypothetical protein A6B43_04785 [Vespertiliibacter pulmonis]RPE83543.1 hypothetical protein EDC46_1236 [Vespertiliibacter pulmonis]